MSLRLPSMLTVLAVSIFAPSVILAEAQEQRWHYLDNGHIRLGVDLQAGASVGWFSHSSSDHNLMNTFDRGRYLQQSYYGDKDGSDWNGQPWRYNPVQGGSWKGVPAQIIEFKAEAQSLYAKTRPRHWATGELAEDMLMEEWLRIDGGLAKLKYRMTYTGKTMSKATHQELPAIFVDPAYRTLFWHDKATHQLEQKVPHNIVPGKPSDMIHVDEPWAAYAKPDGQAFGILFPHSVQATCYRYEEASKVSDCSYIAPLQTFTLTQGLVFDYEIVLAIGTVEQIRTVFAKLPEWKEK
jgi:hypothetical protein